MTTMIRHAHVIFRTNIDCCKKFMHTISGLPLADINPQVGDRVRVYYDTAISVYLRVIYRTWMMTNGHSPYLECELHLEKDMDIPMLEKYLRS